MHYSVASRRGSFRTLISLATLILGGLASSHAATPTKGDPTKDPQIQKALDGEKRSAWIEASRVYEEILRRDRHHREAKEGLRRCHRRIHLSFRHGDASYRAWVGKLTPSQALDAYENTLSLIQLAFPDRSKTTHGLLFREGLAELRMTLEDPLFRSHHLAGLTHGEDVRFRQTLASWPDRTLSTRDEIRDEVMAVLKTATRLELPARPSFLSLLILEMAAGACNSLDEYSSFLSPGPFQMVQAALNGKVAGVGLEIGPGEGHAVIVTRVHSKSPAEEAGLMNGDHLVRIAGHLVGELPLENLASLLLGPEGTSVDLEVERQGDNRLVRLARRMVPLSSVDFQVQLIDDGMMGSMPVGYIRIHHFQESTLQEVKEASAYMLSSAEPIRGLILDLRGNPGGVFKSAVAVAELFAGQGVLVVGQSTFKEFNRSFRATTAGPLQMPLMVMIDGGTASAAEVLAGALQNNRPATRLIGQLSLGKGSIQVVLPMERLPGDSKAGVRLTVARLFSPGNQPYTLRGVTPDVLTHEKGEALLQKAQSQLLGMIKTGMPMNPVGSGTGTPPTPVESRSEMIPDEMGQIPGIR